MPRPLSALTALIRSLPAAPPVADVIARAKEKGFETTEQNIAEVREMASAKPVTDNMAVKAPIMTTVASPPPAASKPSAISKSDFIRNQPLGLSPATVVAIAKARGITLSKSLVRMVRGPEGRKEKSSAPRETPAVKKPASKSKKPTKAVVKSATTKPTISATAIPETSPPSKLTPMSKSGYIRSLPVSMPVKKVIKKAKADGLTFSRALVHIVRSKLAREAAPKKAPARKTASAPKRAKPKKLAPRKSVSAPKKAPTVKPVTMSKSAFIRSVPASTSSKAVVVLGNAAGLKFDESYVAKIRSMAKPTAKKAVPKKRAASRKPILRTTAKSPSPNAVTLKTSSTMSKADFVRANPDLSVKNLVGKALFDGIDLTENYVYKVRRQDKLAAAKKAAAARKPYSKPTISPVVVKPVAEMKPADTKPAVTTPTTTQVEDLLRVVAAELGLGRAVEILAGERAKVRAVIGGE